MLPGGIPFSIRRLFSTIYPKIHTTKEKSSIIKISSEENIPRQRGKSMIVKIKTDPAYGKPEVQICTAAVTPEVEKMAKTIEDALCGSLYAYKD